MLIIPSQGIIILELVLKQRKWNCVHPNYGCKILWPYRVAQSCLILCDPMDCSMPGLPIHHQLPELPQVHVHRVGDAIQPSYPLLSLSPPAFNLFQHQGLFKWFSSSLQVTKVLELQLQHQSFQWLFRTYIFRMEWLDLLAVQGTLKSSTTPQFKTINTSALNFVYGPTLTSIMASGKIIALTIWIC